MPFAPVPQPPMPPYAEPASAYGRATEKVWEAPPLRPPVQPAPPIEAPPSGPIPLKIKVQPPAGYNPPASARSGTRAPRGDDDVKALPYVQRGPTTRSASQFPWKIAAAAVVIAGVGLTLGKGYLSNPKASAETPKPISTPAKPSAIPAGPPPTSKIAGTLTLTSEPSGAVVLVDDQPAGETPLTLSNVAPGRHVLTFQSTSGTVKKTVRVLAGKTLAVDVPMFSGWVAIEAPIILDVSENGRIIGTTEQRRLLLPPGRHQIMVSNRELAYSATHTVEIEAGEERRLVLEPTATVTLNAVPWAEVWIDGKRVGDTPLPNQTIPLGTREILFKHPQHGERRITATIKGTNPAPISVDFTRKPNP
jgi:hypothetical protein